MKTRVVFFGSSIHSLPTLTKLISSNIVEVVAVVTQPDRPVGRKQIITPTPVSQFAQNKTIPVIKPQSSKSILEFKPDLLVVCYYGQKIPIEVIKQAQYGGLNIHPSLLPKYRGAAPGEWVILNGEKETGVTILTLAEEFDTGEIITAEKEPIRKVDTPEDIYKRLFEKGADLLVKILPDYLNNKIDLIKQDNSKATFAPRFTKDNGKIDWSKKPVEIERMIRAFTPWPGTWTEVRIKNQESRLKILKAHLDKDKLVIDVVQLEGKNPVSFEQFKTAYPDFKFL